MNKLMHSTVTASLLLMMVLSVQQVLAKPVVFTQDKFKQLKQQNLGKQWLMLLWSVDCPPCFKELKLIQQLSEEKPDLAVVIVNVDDNDEVNNERELILSRYKLLNFPNYYFADGQGDQSRYFIDSSWYGELPRSYFVEADGKLHGRSGLVNEKILKKWLVGE